MTDRPSGTARATSARPAAAQAPDRNRPGADTDWISRFGTGDPVTLFAHGFSGQIRDTRPFAAGIDGTRALVHLGGRAGAVRRPAPVGTTARSPHSCPRRSPPRRPRAHWACP